MAINQATGSGSVITVTAAAETILLTSLPLNLQRGQFCVLSCAIDITPGTGTTQVTYVIRRGATVASPSVWQSASIVTAGNRTIHSVMGVDIAPGDLAGQQYVLTATQIGATANGTVNVATINITY